MVVIAALVVVEGAQGSWLHGVHGQGAERDECWCSTCFRHFIQSETIFIHKDLSSKWSQLAS